MPPKPSSKDVIEVSSGNSSSSDASPPAGQANVSFDDLMSQMQAAAASPPRTPQAAATGLTPHMRRMNIPPVLSSPVPFPLQRGAQPVQSPISLRSVSSSPEVVFQGSVVRAQNAAPTSTPSRPRPATLFNGLRQFPSTIELQRHQARAFNQSKRASPIGQWDDGLVWRNVFGIMYRRAGYRLRVPMDLDAPFTTLTVSRSKSELGGGLFGTEMTDWLIDIAGLLGRAWRETHDQAMITLPMLIAWHQHYNTRGEAADNAYMIEDDDVDDMDEDEELTIVKVEKKDKSKKKAVKKEGGTYHGPKRGGFGGDEGGEGGGSGGRGPGSSIYQIIEV